MDSWLEKVPQPVFSKEHTTIPTAVAVVILLNRRYRIWLFGDVPGSMSYLRECMHFVRCAMGVLLCLTAMHVALPQLP